MESTLVPTAILPGRMIRKEERPRALLFDMNAIAAIEEDTGKGIDEVFSGGNFAMFRLMTWAGLQHESPNITKNEVGKLMDQGIGKGQSLGEYLKSLSDIVMAALRKNEIFAGGDETGDEATGEDEGKNESKTRSKSGTT